MRTLIVVGSAPSLYADLEAAKTVAPEHEVMLVNGACAALEAAQHVMAGHTEKAPEFAAARDKAFPFALPWRLHATFDDRQKKYNAYRQKPPQEAYPMVTDWWPRGLFSGGATSAGKAAAIGLAMGFSRVILAGCPMDGSGYFPGESEGIGQLRACQRIGDPSKQRAATIRRYRERMAELAATTFKGRVFSMSGFTREVLGAP